MGPLPTPKSSAGPYRASRELVLLPSCVLLRKHAAVSPWGRAQPPRRPPAHAGRTHPQSKCLSTDRPLRQDGPQACTPSARLLLGEPLPAFGLTSDVAPGSACPLYAHLVPHPHPLPTFLSGLVPKERTIVRLQDLRLPSCRPSAEPPRERRSGPPLYPQPGDHLGLKYYKIGVKLLKGGCDHRPRALN